MNLAVLWVVVGSVFDLRSLSEDWTDSTVLWIDHYAFSAVRHTDRDPSFIPNSNPNPD